MKILTIAATPFFSNRGCHIRIYNEAKYLQKLGVKVEICTYHNGEEVKGIKTHRIGSVGWYKKTSPGFAWGKVWLDLKLFFLCAKMLKKSEFDIIHAHLFESLAIAKIAKLFTFKRIPIVLDLQGDISEEFSSYNKKNKIIAKFFNWLSRIVFNWADAIVGSSQNSFEKIQEKYSSKKPLIIVGDGIDLDIFENKKEDSLSKKEELEEIKRWKGGDKVIIYTGGMSDNKGVGELLGSFIEKVGSQNWKLLLFGTGNDLEKYRKIVEEKSFSEKIWFAKENGYFQLPNYLEMAELAIDPKKDSSESSAKITNYMAVGLPIICFENDFNKKMLGDSGIYLKNWQEFSSKIENIAKSNLMEKKKYELEKFSEKKQVEILLELFKNCVEKNKQN